jgi:parallel beta-helix repeat protein
MFRNNYAHDNGKRGLYIGSGDGNQAYNNIIVDNNGGISIRGRHTKIFNNTVYNNAGDGMDVGPGVIAVIRNNIIYNNGRAIWNQSNDATIDHNLTSDPLFVDPASHDFTLQAASPAIDAGLTLSEVRYDYEKVPRPQGGGYDIGAYE